MEVSIDKGSNGYKMTAATTSGKQLSWSATHMVTMYDSHFGSISVAFLLPLRFDFTMDKFSVSIFQVRAVAFELQLREQLQKRRKKEIIKPQQLHVWGCPAAGLPSATAGHLRHRCGHVIPRPPSCACASLTLLIS